MLESSSASATRRPDGRVLAAPSRVRTSSPMTQPRSSEKPVASTVTSPDSTPVVATEPTNTAAAPRNAGRPDRSASVRNATTPTSRVCTGSERLPSGSTLVSASSSRLGW